MLEFFILAVGFAGGYAASIYSWPSIRASAIGASAEIARLRARARALEDQIKGAL
jgi:membrane associated rhomboid family serine protease